MKKGNKEAAKDAMKGWSSIMPQFHKHFGASRVAIGKRGGKAVGKRGK